MNNVADLKAARLSRDEAKQALRSLKETVEDDRSTGMGETEAKIAAAEARTDTKFAELMGEIRLLNGRMQHFEESLKATSTAVAGIRTNIWLAAATAIGITAAIVSYGAATFSNGMTANGIANQAVERATQQSAERFSAIETQLERQAQQIDLVVQALSRSGDANPAPEGDAVPAPFESPGDQPRN